MSLSITLTINGAARAITLDDPRITLLDLLRERLDGLDGLQMCEAPEATDGELALAHTPAYLSAVIDGTLNPAQQREIGFPWSEAMVARARRSVGATVCAARAALISGLAANLAGGTHHASADKGSGFCVFNDAAVAGMGLGMAPRTPPVVARGGDRSRCAPGQRHRLDFS